MIEPRRAAFISQRLKLNHVDWGNEDAPPLMLVHGARDHARAWDDVARSLSAQFHVIAPDLRGHGDSQWADTGGYAVISFVFDLAELIHQLGFAQVTLIGHSLGGNIALRMTGLYAALALIEGAGHWVHHDRPAEFMSALQSFLCLEGTAEDRKEALLF